MNQKNSKKSLKIITVIGLGYVGLPLALLASKRGYNVFGIDLNKEKIDLINKRISPIKDRKISQQLKELKITATSDFSCVKNASIIIICVPTPVYENHMPDLRPIEGACKSIVPFLKKGHLVVLESTVNPGVSEEVIIPILEKESGLKCGRDFYLAHCPERINPGDAKWDVENIPRVVGSYDKKGLKMAVDFYSSIISAPIKPMNSLKEAEAVKVVENSFRDINIAFVNELAMSFSCLGIDIVNVIEGASTKPFSFMAHFPGCGVGGHCIPVDPYYLIEYAKKNDFDHDFLSLARKINNYMPQFTVEQTIKALNESNIFINNAKVAVLGLSYKANIDDCRESPSFEIIKHLQKAGANVVSFDPFVLQKSTVKSLKEAVKGVKAVVIATAHKDFKKLTPKFFLENGVKVIVDGRNCLDKQKFIKAGIIYKGIGT
mgnify:CR=1 FL=1